MKLKRSAKSNTALIIVSGVLLAVIVFLVLILIPMINKNNKDTDKTVTEASDDETVSAEKTAEVSEDRIISSDSVSAEKTESENAVTAELQYIDDVCKYTDATLDSYTLYNEFSDASGTKFTNADIYVDDGGYPVKMAFNADSNGLMIVSYFINKRVDGRSVIEPYYYDNNLVYLYAFDNSGNKYCIYLKGDRDSDSPVGHVIAYKGTDGQISEFPDMPDFNTFLAKYTNTNDAAIINEVFNTAAPMWYIPFEGASD